MGFAVAAVIILALVSLFSLQNATPVRVSLLFWEFNASLAVVIFLSMLAGVAAGAILILWVKLKGSSKRPGTGAPGA